MTLYRVTNYMRIPTDDTIKPWTNVYYVDTATKDLAAAAGFAISGIQKGVTKEYVEFYRSVAQQPGVAASSPSVQDYSNMGEQVGNVSQMLPLFNTVRVRFVDGVSRPSQKYLRIPLEEGDILNGGLEQGFIDLITNDYCAQLMAFAPLRSDDGADFSSIAIVPRIQMRQTDWKRRTRPGFIRGWVPV